MAIILKKNAHAYSERMLIVVLVRAFSRMALRRDAKVRFPVLLNCRWKLVQSRQKCSQFPHVLIVEGMAPRRHSGVTNPRSDGVVNMPLGIVERIENELRRRRVHGVLEQAGLVIQSSVAHRAIHGVKLYSIN
jgi:hypothetical protein